MIEALYGVLIKIIEQLPALFTGMIIGIVVYRIYFNWQVELQEEMKHLEELRNYVIKPLLVTMERVTHGSFPKCNIKNGKVAVSLAEMYAVKLALKEEEIIERFSNELLNDLIEFHVPKLGELIREYCRLCEQHEANREKIEQLIKELAYKELSQYDIDKEIAYSYIRDCFTSGGPDECKKILDKHTKLSKVEEEINIYQVGSYSIKSSMDLSTLKNVLTNLIKIIEESEAMKLYLENEEIKKIEELAKNRVSEKVIENAIRSEVNKKFKEIIRQL